MAQPIKKEQKRTEITKDVLLQNLEQNMGNVTLACHFGKCSRSTFYRIALDIAESEMWKLIKDGNVPTILFYLKCKGKNRGYVERQEITGQDGQPISWNETKTYAVNESISKTNNSN